MIEYADIVCDLVYGDCGKGKISAYLAKTNEYDLVARWAGGNNAGHTVFKDGAKYKTHLIPSGVFYNIPTLIGPGCVLHPESFFQEIKYLKDNGFSPDLIKVHPNCHIVLDEHIEQDKQNLSSALGTTSKGIAYAYAAKAARVGVLAKDVLPEKYLWKSNLHGKILCEGAQGFWLDQDQGNYPFVTSSITLPYGACSLGFPPQKIRKVFGIAKIYDTRSGQDPAFPESLFNDPELLKLGDLGQELGVTTGRRRKVNWLNLDKLIESTKISGTTDLIINKCDILSELGIYKLFFDGKLVQFNSIKAMEGFILNQIHDNCLLVMKTNFSYSPENI
jgi:adenylosuccinate synthase